MMGKFERVPYTFVSLSQRFIVDASKNIDDQMQYAQCYHIRLKELAVPLRQQAKKWGAIPFRKLSELKIGEEAWVLGTLYKESARKPNILKEVAEAVDEGSSADQPILPRYVGKDDTLFLEEFTQRIVLGEGLDKNTVCTGIEIALRGKEDEQGIFAIYDYCLPGFPPQPAKSLSESDM